MKAILKDYTQRKESIYREDKSRKAKEVQDNKIVKK
jgi:hypothetical protein